MNRTVINLLRTLALVYFAYVCIPAFAQTPGDINVHIDVPVAVPGQLLEPGDYQFRVDPDDPSTLTIKSADGKSSVGFFHVLPTTRVGTEGTEIDLLPPDSAGVRRIQSWYDAGESIGFEFNYSKKDVARLDELARANASRISVGQ